MNSSVALLTVILARLVKLSVFDQLEDPRPCQRLSVRAWCGLHLAVGKSCDVVTDYYAASDACPAPFVIDTLVASSLFQFKACMLTAPCHLVDCRVLVSLVVRKVRKVVPCGHAAQLNTLPCNRSLDYFQESDCLWLTRYFKA
jgi:hypothetical protein